MFSDELLKIDWDQTTQSIQAKRESDVLRALSKEHCNVDDFMALISPAAEPYLEQMAQLSRKYTMQRFGKTISMFIPLYITNSCTNSCVYCGFHVSNPMPRTILTIEQIEDEYKAIKALGPFENILLVTGENPAKAGVDYILAAVELARKYFANVKIEVMPLKSEEYKTIADHGMNGVVCFQETYHRENYKIYHPKGMKSNFEWRVNGFDRMGQAGVHSIGMGVLVGLEEWRTDMTMMAYHLRYLQKNYWQTKYSVNFPRMRKAENDGFQPNVIMSDRELAQLTFAFRIFDHDVDISYSTREPAFIRNNMATLGVTTMSAQSSVEPGGYYTYKKAALPQFNVTDERTVSEVIAALKEAGREPVFKDWDDIMN
ncbi:MAG: 2-iminoacetate synthase ThiH [Marinilabiliaceae bacterium]|nr:2-iminoacetate synthase ThiH [Marinilabiliaceae bacterium]